jgi:hypothetical protein
MKKKFDAVQFQRQRRDELSKEYSLSRKEFLRELEEKYSGLRKPRNKRPINNQNGVRA